MVGSDLLAEQDQGGVSVAFLHVAEDLIVGAILLDDVYHVFDERGFTGAQRNGYRLSASPFRFHHGSRTQLKMIVLGHGCAVAIELPRVGNWNDCNRSAIGMDIAFLLRFLPSRSGAEQRGYGEI